MSTTDPPIRVAVRLAGGPRKLARAVSASPSQVAGWLADSTAKHYRPVPPPKCVAIEALVRGAVTRADLRPDDWREYWPDFVVPAKSAETSHA